jgi:hypothetical protein
MYSWAILVDVGTDAGDLYFGRCTRRRNAPTLFQTYPRLTREDYFCRAHDTVEGYLYPGVKYHFQLCYLMFFGAAVNRRADAARWRHRRSIRKAPSWCGSGIAARSRVANFFEWWRTSSCCTSSSANVKVFKHASSDTHSRRIRSLTTAAEHVSALLCRSRTHPRDILKSQSISR